MQPLPKTCGPACLTRIHRIHTLLAANRPVNAEHLARELEISSRTIKRDIDLMRDNFGAPIEWDATRKTHRYTRPYELALAAANPRINADEALALILASRAFAAWRGSPLGRALCAALEKMKPMLGDSLSLTVQELGSIIYEPHASDDHEAVAEKRYLLSLLGAIRLRRVIRINYQKPTDGNPMPRELHPLHLAIIEQRWMLVAYEPRQRAIRKFLLTRITDIQDTNVCFEPPANFDASAYFAGSIGLFTGKETFAVRIRFDAFAAPFIRERRWHPSQTLLELPHGKIEARIRLNNLIDVQRWILGWGRHAVAIGPAALVRALKSEATATLANYKALSPARAIKTRKNSKP